MRQHSVQFATVIAAISVFFSAANASAQYVRIANDSDWNVEYLFLSYAGSWDWGPDQLGQDVLYAGGDWIDLQAPCAYYDLRLVDEDGDECVVSNIHLCNEEVAITNQDLLSCQDQTLAYGGVGGAPVTCGLGFEVVLALIPLSWLRRRKLAAQAC